MNPRLRKWLKFTLRWGIAVFGITWVLLRTSFHDHVLIVDSNNKKLEIRINDGQPLDASQFQVFYGGNSISRSEVWTPPGDQSSVPVWGADGKKHSATVLAIHPAPDQQRNQPPAQLLVRDPQTGNPRVISPAEVVDGYTVRVVYPLVEVGLIRLLQEARPLYLLLAVALLPICFLITSIRWHSLLEAQDIHIRFGLTFVINMVGSFYNSFMPGLTGGDLVKAYYAAKHTSHRTRAVMTVIIDRILGLVALIILGGIMAGIQYNIPTCRQVAIISGALILAMAVGLFVFYHPDLRRRTGLDWLLKRLPMQGQVHRAVEAMELFGKRPWVAVRAVIITFPVHMTTIISATFAGKAFLLPLHALYYWAIVPVLALVGAIPISPQGVGVMEPLAVELTRRQGVTVSQAFALVMAIRFSQIFWNLLASIFVLRGGYHAVTQTEAEELEHDEDEAPGEPAIPELAK
jgi:uncharacterized protein (TIRG00374 family)